MQILEMGARFHREDSGAVPLPLNPLGLCLLMRYFKCRTNKRVRRFIFTKKAR